jgi:hypothetical protein
VLPSCCQLWNKTVTLRLSGMSLSPNSLYSCYYYIQIGCSIQMMIFGVACEQVV